MRIGVILFLLIGFLCGEEDIHSNIKHSLRANMMHWYDENPAEVDNLKEMLTEGMYYGRLRFNSFGFKWKEELQVKGIDIRKDHAIAGLGGKSDLQDRVPERFWNGSRTLCDRCVGDPAPGGSLTKRERYI